MKGGGWERQCANTMATTAKQIIQKNAIVITTSDNFPNHQTNHRHATLAAHTFTPCRSISGEVLYMYMHNVVSSLSMYIHVYAR